MQLKPSNIFYLGIKELRSFMHDRLLLVLVAYAFSLGIHMASTAQPEALQHAPIAIVDEDQSPLSQRIAAAFYPPHFTHPRMIGRSQMDRGLDEGDYTFALNIPPDFQRDLLAGRKPEIQLNIDATRMAQAFTGNSYVQQILHDEVTEFMEGHRSATELPVDLAIRARFNPTLTQSWFAAVMELINNVTMLSIVLTGAALIREREHGTVEHLLVMPVTPFQIMASKVWSMGLVVLLASSVSLVGIIEGVLSIPVEGSALLFMAGAGLHLFATTSMGIFMGTIARSMPQFGLLMMLVLLPLQMLSGGMTPRESMPDIVQTIMLIAPTTHFVKLAQAILYRGAGIETVWPQFLALAVIGTVLFAISLARFRRAISTMA